MPCRANAIVNVLYKWAVEQNKKVNNKKTVPYLGAVHKLCNTISGGRAFALM
jgi:hypothetical protein